MRHLLFAMILLGSWPSLAAEIILSSQVDNPQIQAFLRSVKELRASDDVRFIALRDLPQASQLNKDVRLILLDHATLQWRLASDQGPPTLAMRISRAQARVLLGERRARGVTLLWSDPPFARQLRLLQKIIPYARHVGVAYDPQNEFRLQELQTVAEQLNLKLILTPWPDTRDRRPLADLLKQSDALFGMDSPRLYNPQNIKNLLLTSYEQNRGLLGPTVNFVRAGSIASTYSDQADWLKTLNSLLDKPAQQWPQEYFPQHFKVQTNRQVMRSLGLDAGTDELLAEQLRQMEATQ